MLEIYDCSDEDQKQDQPSVAASELVDHDTVTSATEAFHYDTYKILYAIAILASALTVPYGVFPAAAALYYADKYKYPKIIIILNILWVLFLIYDFMLIVFNIYLIPGSNYYEDISWLNNICIC